MAPESATSPLQKRRMTLMRPRQTLKLNGRLTDSQRKQAFLNEVDTSGLLDIIHDAFNRVETGKGRDSVREEEGEEGIREDRHQQRQQENDDKDEKDRKESVTLHLSRKQLELMIQCFHRLQTADVSDSTTKDVVVKLHDARRIRAMSEQHEVQSLQN